MKTKIYVLSYLPSRDDSRFENRRKNIFKQLEWFSSEVNTDLMITYLAQNWPDDILKSFNDLISKCSSERFHSRNILTDIHIECTKFNWGVSLGRNILIERYISEEESPAFFFDDDVMCMTSDKKVNVFDFVDLIPNSIKYDTLAFKDSWYKFSDVPKDESLFKNSIELSAAVFRVMGKYVFSSGIRFDSKVTACEDTDMVISIVTSGMTNLVCVNPYMYQFPVQTLIAGTTEDRKKMIVESKYYMAKKWTEKLGAGMISYDGNKMMISGIRKKFLTIPDFRLKRNSDNKYTWKKHSLFGDM